MKRYEKILLIIFGVVFALQLFVIPLTTALFAFTTWILCASYIIGGHWLFKAKENKKTSLCISAGIVLGVSLANLPYLIWLFKGTYVYFLPIANGLLCLYLLGYLFVKRKSEKDLGSIKLIFIRSLIILTVSSFFTYIPITFKPYRSVVYALNNGNDRTQANIRIFDYTAEYEDALKNDECEKAIHYALKAEESGRIWLGIPLEYVYGTSEKEGFISAQDYLIRSQLWKMSGAYTNLYKAYNCKADDHYEKLQYEKALAYYIKSDKALEPWPE